MTFFHDSADSLKEVVDRLRDSADESPNGHYAARHAALEIAFWLEGRLPMRDPSTQVIVKTLRAAARRAYQTEEGERHPDDVCKEEDAA